MEGHSRGSTSSRDRSQGKEEPEGIRWTGAGATQAALGFAGKSSSPASSQDATEVQHRMDEKAVFRAVARGDPDRPRWIVPCAARIQVRRLSGATSCHRNPNVKPNLLIPAEYSVVFGHSKCLARAGAARCAPTLYFANINNKLLPPFNLPKRNLLRPTAFNWLEAPKGEQS